MRRLLLSTAAALALTVTPAHGQAVNAPPGNSGVDEYLETIPGVQGPRPTDRATSGRRLPSGVRRELAESGATGRELADVAEATAPPPASAARREGDRYGGVPRNERRADPGPSALDTAADVVTGGQPGGMGVLLPAFLLGTLVIGAAVAARRRLFG